MVSAQDRSATFTVREVVDFDSPLRKTDTYESLCQVIAERSSRPFN
ncbi:hypothetical protein COLO4_03274 [Corchorus olitorius]|uniref:Uncharacterized protein n=1 Tax=Corchorus olitorius TaxID=93759 RepID=A0A1R3KZ68_9ROSI|nr:hypothetical protein COLO4_03274 [Corchorus olitorius]